MRVRRCDDDDDDDDRDSLPKVPQVRISRRLGAVLPAWWCWCWCWLVLVAFQSHSVALSFPSSSFPSPRWPLLVLRLLAER